VKGKENSPKRYIEQANQPGGFPHFLHGHFRLMLLLLINDQFPILQLPLIGFSASKRSTVGCTWGLVAAIHCTWQKNACIRSNWAIGNTTSADKQLDVVTCCLWVLNTRVSRFLRIEDYKIAKKDSKTISEKVLF
jgi:hypothetical protein